MSLENEYGKPYQRNEPENLQSVIIKYFRYIIKSLYPERIIGSNLDKQTKTFEAFTAECEYHLDFRPIDKNKAFGVATIYRPTQFRNQ